MPDNDSEVRFKPQTTFLFGRKDLKRPDAYAHPAIVQGILKLFFSHSFLTAHLFKSQKNKQITKLFGNFNRFLLALLSKFKINLDLLVSKRPGRDDPAFFYYSPT